MPPKQPQTSDDSARAGPPATVAVYIEVVDERLRMKAAQLAEQLHLPLTFTPDAAYEFLLTITDELIELRSTQRNGPGPTYVDFVGGPLGYSVRAGGSRLLFRAIGVRPGLRVIDATAGLGRDAFLLTCSGCDVTAIERSPILAAMLRDGIDRATRDPRQNPARESGAGPGTCVPGSDIDKCLNNLKFIVGDARDVLRKLPPDERPDVVYLDPMFPPKKKSALVKKEMRILRRIVGDDEDAGELFAIARGIARRRVVVKRMRQAPELAPHPTRVYESKTIRYDVYDTRVAM